MVFCIEAYNASMHFNDMLYKLKSVTGALDGFPLCYSKTFIKNTDCVFLINGWSGRKNIKSHTRVSLSKKRFNERCRAVNLFDPFS